MAYIYGLRVINIIRSLSAKNYLSKLTRMEKVALSESTFWRQIRERDLQCNRTSSQASKLLASKSFMIIFVLEHVNFDS